MIDSWTQLNAVETVQTLAANDIRQCDVYLCLWESTDTWKSRDSVLLWCQWSWVLCKKMKVGGIIETSAKGLKVVCCVGWLHIVQCNVHVVYESIRLSVMCFNQGQVGSCWFSQPVWSFSSFPSMSVDSACKFQMSPTSSQVDSLPNCCTLGFQPSTRDLRSEPEKLFWWIRCKIDLTTVWFIAIYCRIVHTQGQGQRGGMICQKQPATHILMAWTCCHLVPVIHSKLQNATNCMHINHEKQDGRERESETQRKQCASPNCHSS